MGHAPHCGLGSSPHPWLAGSRSGPSAQAANTAEPLAKALWPLLMHQKSGGTLPGAPSTLPRGDPPPVQSRICIAQPASTVRTNPPDTLRPRIGAALASFQRSRPLILHKIGALRQLTLHPSSRTIGSASGSRFCASCPSTVLGPLPARHSCTPGPRSRRTTWCACAAGFPAARAIPRRR